MMRTKLPYRELLGSLMYLIQGTRPDIAHAVRTESMVQALQFNWACAKRILRYLKGTINHGLHYTRCTTQKEPRRIHRLGKLRPGSQVMYWFRLHACRRYHIMESRKQRTVALFFSSTETEYTAPSDTAREAIYLQGFLSEIGLPLLSRVILHNDNQSAAKLAVNPVFHSRSKHIDIKCHFIRQALVEHHIDLLYTPTENMVADILTKTLPSNKHSFCVSRLVIEDVELSRTQI